MAGIAVTVATKKHVLRGLWYGYLHAPASAFHHCWLRPFVQLVVQAKAVIAGRLPMKCALALPYHRNRNQHDQ